MKTKYVLDKNSMNIDETFKIQINCNKGTANQNTYNVVNLLRIIKLA